MKKSEIVFNITTDSDKHPVDIKWKADDAGIEGEKSCQSVMIALWDHKEQTSLRIDLWTKDMKVDEMKQFFFESLHAMAETYLRATSDQKGSAELREFAQRFARLAISTQ